MSAPANCYRNSSSMPLDSPHKTGVEDSYYVKVEGAPSKLLIGEHPDDAEDVSVLTF